MHKLLNDVTITEITELYNIKSNVYKEILFFMFCDLLYYLIIKSLKKSNPCEIDVFNFFFCPYNQKFITLLSPKLCTVPSGHSYHLE